MTMLEELIDTLNGIHPITPEISELHDVIFDLLLYLKQKEEENE